jgi:hypothetical protein
MIEGYTKIYSTLNTAEAHIIQFLLQNNGIEAIIKNEDMTPLFGMVAAKDAETQVWVPSGREKEASALLKESSSIDISNVTLVKCKRCGEMVCDRFDYCWNCMSDMKTGEPYRGADAIADTVVPGKSGRLSLFLFVAIIAILIAALAYYTYRYFNSAR